MTQPAPFTAVIPDIHERLGLLDQVLENTEGHPRVFLGDWFDTFDKFDERRVERVCEQILEAIARGDRLLIGNHDAHYFFGHDGFLCSGFDPRKREIVQSLISKDTICQFLVSVKVGGYVLSHAGWHQLIWDVYQESGGFAADPAYIEAALDGYMPEIFQAGRARSGPMLVGGPTWLDWNREFQDIPNMKQLVGHTHGAEPRTLHSGSTCIDCGLRYYALIDANNPEAVPYVHRNVDVQE